MESPSRTDMIHGRCPWPNASDGSSRGRRCRQRGSPRRWIILAVLSTPAGSVSLVEPGYSRLSGKGPVLAVRFERTLKRVLGSPPLPLGYASVVPSADSNPHCPRFEGGASYQLGYDGIGAHGWIRTSTVHHLKVTPPADWATCRSAPNPDPHNGLELLVKSLILLVGAGRFELPTPSPPDCRGGDNLLF